MATGSQLRSPDPPAVGRRLGRSGQWWGSNVGSGQTQSQGMRHVDLRDRANTLLRDSSLPFKPSTLLRGTRPVHPRLP